MEPLRLLVLIVRLVGADDADLVQNGPECQPLDRPKRLPAAAELIDSTALAGQIALASGTVSGELQIGVAFPRPSGPPEAWVIDSGVAPDGLARLAALVQTALRPGAAPPGTTLRIHLRLGTPNRIHVQRSVLCPPVPMDSAGAAQTAYKVSEGSGKGPAHRWNAVVRQRIGIDGQVLDARLQPGSGRADVDRLALEPVLARRWRPATLDGRPVEVWLANGRVELAR